jgi:hypothetical protein
MTRRADGNVTVLMLAAVVLAALLAVAVSVLGDGAARKARADTAADAAALAVANVLASGAPPGRAVAAARRIAAANGGRLLECRCGGRVAEVVVALDDARARARAEVDP